MQSTKISLIFLCLFLLNTFVLVGIQGTPTDLTEEFSTEGNYFTQKLDYKLQSFLISNNNDKTSPIRIIINFENATSMTNGITKVNSLSSEIRFLHKWQLIPAAIFKTPIACLNDIACLPEVRKIWLDWEFYIENIQGHSADQAQTSTLKEEGGDVPIITQETPNYAEIYNGSNVIVALLDTGIDIFHPDLNGSILAFGGVSLVEGDPYPLDFHGHGTFCAGLITGNGVINNKIRGMAPNVNILNVKVLSSSGFGLWSWIVSGIEYAITHGADIISMCFSMPGFPGDPVNLAIDAATKRGMIVVTAVGDEGPAFSSVSTPGMAQAAITVGAYNDFSKAPASFSARGPTLSLHIKPDLLASGVNITSCRPIMPSNLPINLTELFKGVSGYGLPLDAYYTVVNSTSAAAANVTGMVASLLQHAKFLSAEEVKIILQKTAVPLPNIGSNVQGAGLVNFAEAHAYLAYNGLNMSLTENRLYTPTFFSPGYISSQNASRNITMFVTNYGSLLAIIDSRANETFTHMIQGQLAVKYNNQLKWLSDMYLLRELHNLTPEFSKTQSILTDYSIICIFTAEAWPSISGFRVNLTIINLASTALQNLSLYSLWQTNLFFNASAQVSNDVGEYNGTDDIIYDHDSKDGKSSYIGFSGMIRSHSHEVNSSENIRDQMEQNSLLNNTFCLDPNNAIAMEWVLASYLNSTKNLQFSESIGLANSYDTLKNAISTIKILQTSDNQTNLALLSSNISRMGLVNQPYTSDVLLMNIGNTFINNTFVTLLINSTEAQTQTFFSKYINLGPLAPFEFRRINATWNPTEVDIYSLYWIVGTETLINELIFYFMNITRRITQEQFFWDNFFIRNVFIKDGSYQLHDIFPKTLPIAPYLIYFPNDVSIFNISIITNHPLTHLEVLSLDGNLPLTWITCKAPQNIQDFGSLQITISVPSDPKIGIFYRRIGIRADNNPIGDLWINFSIRYPSGRILFYKPSFNLSLQDSFQMADLLTLWNERLDTIYSGYFECYKLCLENNYAVTDFRLLKQIQPNISLDTTINLPFKLPYQTSTLKQNFTFISNYDLVILFDPQVNLSQSEITALINFGKNGGSLFFWVEPKSECEQYSINSILSNFSIQVLNSYNFSVIQSFLTPNQHEITMNLTKIKLFSFTTFSNFSTLTRFTQYNGEATSILNNSNGKILCVGDSDAFNDSCILSSDNLAFLNRSINWLLKEKINISVFINRENASEPLRINQHLSISIHLTSIDHKDLSNNLTLFTFLITPSNRTLYMIFFHTQEGWYNALYPSQWLNETGPYFLVIHANSPSHASDYAVQVFILESALPPGGDTSVDRIWSSQIRILIGILIFLSITGVLVGLFLFQRWQWRRQMTIVELKEKLKRDISNALNEYHLFIKEIEELLHEPQVLDQDKLPLILDKQERTKNLLNKLKKLGKHV